MTTEEMLLRLSAMQPREQFEHPGTFSGALKQAFYRLDAETRATFNITPLTGKTTLVSKLHPNSIYEVRKPNVEAKIAEMLRRGGPLLLRDVRSGLPAQTQYTIDVALRDMIRDGLLVEHFTYGQAHYELP